MRCSVASHLRLAGNAVMQPVGDVLRGNAQRRAILHQSDIVDVRHFGTADALVDPAHHVAQNALAVVVQFLLHVIGRPVRPVRQRDGQQVGQRRARARRQLGLPGGDIDLVIMQRVQRRGGGRGHPGGVGAGHRMADLLRQHVGHAVGRRPHALADLRLAAQPAGQADIDVLVLVGLDPGVCFISPLRIIGPACIEVWISSPVRSRKPVLMNTTRSFAAKMQAFRLAEVRRSSSMTPIFSV